MGKSKITLAAENEKLLLQAYNIDFTKHVTDQPVNTSVDITSIEILKVFHPVVLTEVTPFCTIGDGNCMYRSVSLSMTGTERHHLHLRLLCALEILTYRQHYDVSHRKYVDLIQDQRVFVPSYNVVVNTAVKIYEYAELSHMYALSAALGEPINSYYPPLISETYSLNPLPVR